MHVIIEQAFFYGIGNVVAIILSHHSEKSCPTVQGKKIFTNSCFWTIFDLPKDLFKGSKRYVNFIFNA